MNRMAYMNKNRSTYRLNSGRQQAGFTFIELVIVIILLGLLAAAALPRYLDVVDDAQNASLEAVAGAFTTGINIARAQWFADGYSRGQLTSQSDKISINLDGKIIYMNENGWPANTGPADDASEDTQTAEECQDVWTSVLQAYPASTTNENDRVNANYFISVLDQQGGDSTGNTADICRFEMILNSDAATTPTHYFDYDLTDGEVVVTKPKLN